MRKGFTLMEVLVACGLLMMLIGLTLSAASAYNRSKSDYVPQPTKTEYAGPAEAKRTRTTSRVEPNQIQRAIDEIPVDAKIVQIVPVFDGCGPNLKVVNYVVITEKE